MWPVKWQVCPGAHAREGPQAAGRVVLTPATSQGGRLHRGLHQLWAPRLLCRGSEAVSGDGGVGGEGASESKREVYSGHHGAGRDVLCLNDGAGVRPASQHSPPAARPRRVREGDGAAEPSASPVTHVHRGSGLELEATHPAPLVSAGGTGLGHSKRKPRTRHLPQCFPRHPQCTTQCKQRHDVSRDSKSLPFSGESVLCQA